MKQPLKLFLYPAHDKEPIQELITWLEELPEGLTATVALGEANDDTPCITFTAT